MRLRNRHVVKMCIHLRVVLLCTPARLSVLDPMTNAGHYTCVSVRAVSVYVCACVIVDCFDALTVACGSACSRPLVCVFRDVFSVSFNTQFIKKANTAFKAGDVDWPNNAPAPPGSNNLSLEMTFTMEKPTRQTSISKSSASLPPMSPRRTTKDPSDAEGSDVKPILKTASSSSHSNSNTGGDDAGSRGGIIPYRGGGDAGGGGSNVPSLPIGQVKPLDMSFEKGPQSPRRVGFSPDTADVVPKSQPSPRGVRRVPQVRVTS